MEHKNHIKRTISVHMVNLQQKISSWLISNVSMRFILSQNYFLWILNDDDATCWDLAPRADFREVAALLPLDQEAGVRDDNLHRACFFFFFFAKAPIGTCQILEGCAESPGKPCTLLCTCERSLTFSRSDASFSYSWQMPPTLRTQHFNPKSTVASEIKQISILVKVF